MSTDTAAQPPMNTLEPAGLEAAISAYNAFEMGSDVDTRADDLVERLKDHYRTDIGMAAETADDIANAAAEISTLRARVAELEARATPSEAEPVAWTAPMMAAMMFECVDCTNGGSEENCHPANRTFIVGNKCVCEDCYYDGRYPVPAPRASDFLATPPDSDAVRALQTLRTVRDMLEVEYHDDGRIACVAHESGGLREMVRVLDAALSNQGSSSNGQ